MMSSPIRFATDLDKEFTEVEAQILSVHNAQIGRIIKIDTQGLTYKFYYSDNDYLQIEAEETPGSIENSDSFGQYLTDVEFQVEIDLI